MATILRWFCFLSLLLIIGNIKSQVSPSLDIDWTIQISDHNVLLKDFILYDTNNESAAGGVNILADKLPNMNVVAVNPGSSLNTNMVREAYGRFWSPAEKGGDILYDIALSDEYKGITGKYFDNDKGDPKGTFGDAHPDAYDKVAITRLISETNKILERL